MKEQRRPITPRDAFKNFRESIFYVRSPVPFGLQAGRTELPRVEASDGRFVKFNEMSEINSKFKTQGGFPFGLVERNTDIPGTFKPKVT